MFRSLARLGLALAAVCLLAPLVRADTVVLFDGRKFNGEVVESGSGLIIRTKFGEVRVEKDDVSDWEKGDAAKPSTSPSPTPSPSQAGSGNPSGSSDSSNSSPQTTTPDNKSTGPTLAGAANPTAPGPSTKPGAAAAVEMLTRSGMDALSDGDDKSARDLFLDASQLDPRNLKILNALGIVYCHLGDFAHAHDQYDQALLLTATPDSSLVINAAAVELAAKNPMHAAKLTKEYLAAHPEKVDERVFDALGIALDQADTPARRTRFFAQSVEFYMSINNKLEASRPGEKRWGVHWMSPAEADSSAAKLSDRRAQFKKLTEELATATAKASAAKVQVDQERQSALRKADKSTFELTFATQQLQQAQAALADVQNRHHEYSANYMPFPDRIELAMPEGYTPTVAVAPEKPEPTPTPTTVAIVTPDAPKPDAPTVDPKLDDPKPEDPKPEAPKPEAPKPEEPKPEAPQPEPAAHYNPPPRPMHTNRVQIPVYAAAFPVTNDLVVTSADVVANASQVILQSSDGLPIKAEVVRVDGVSGLALLRVSGIRLQPLLIADNFAGGPVQCAAYPSVSIFNPTAELVDAQAPAPNEPWTIRFSRHPRLPGSAVMSGGQVVGVELASRDDDMSKISAVSVTTLLRFLGDDILNAHVTGHPDPCTVSLQVTATH